MAKAATMTIQVPGAEVNINYNEVSNRITNIDWVLPAGVVARVRIWDTRDPEPNLIYDQSFGGPQTGAENVPGNHRMVEHPDGYIELPAYLEYNIGMQTIGV